MPSKASKIRPTGTWLKFTPKKFPRTMCLPNTRDKTRRYACRHPAPKRCQRGRQSPAYPLLHFLDFVFYLFCPLGIEPFFTGGKLVEQSQKLSSVYTFFVRYVLEHFRGELVVRRLGKLGVHLSRFVLRGHHETNCSDELLIGELPVVCQP